MERRGQIAIFFIIAAMIVVIILAVFLVPKVKVGFTGEVNPTSFLRDCIQPRVNEGIQMIAKQGGSIEPDNFVMYQDDKIEFLCYTSSDYVPCVVQQPLLVSHAQKELKDYIEPTAQQCVSDLKALYEQRGFDVTGSPGEINVSIVPGRIDVEFLSPMSVTKDRTETFSKFAISVDSEIYDLMMTATSIIQFESTLGDSDPLLYVQYYPDLQIEKINRDDGVTIYKLRNVVSEDEFSFASRSLVFPPGYGVG